MTTLALVLHRAKSPVVFDAIKDIGPMALAVIPIGLTVGASAAAAPISGLAGWLGGPLIAAGSVHIAVISLLSTGASAGVVILAALAIGARFAAYSAALSPAFAGQPTWFKLLGPYVLVDQTYAVASNRMSDSEAGFRRYLLVASAVLLAVWLVAVSTGLALGRVIPEALQLWIVMPLLFAGMSAKAMVDKAAMAGLLTATITALALSPLPSGLGLTAGIVAGTVAGWMTRGDR
jgi:predicted branched-subunit amino acid permease